MFSCCVSRAVGARGTLVEVGACDRTEGCLGIEPLPPCSLRAPSVQVSGCSGLIAPGLWPIELVDRQLPDKWCGQPSERVLLNGRTVGRTCSSH